MSTALSPYQQMMHCDREIARQLIRERKTTNDLWIREIMDDLHVEEREKSEISGRCSGGCREANLIESHQGMICNLTRQPCDKISLALIVDRLGSLNRGETNCISPLVNTTFVTEAIQR